MYLFVGCAGSLLLLGLFSSCGKQGRSPGAARGLLTVAASLVEEHGLQQAWHTGSSSCSSQASGHNVSSCGAQARWLYGTWDLPWLGGEPASQVDSLQLNHPYWKAPKTPCNF